MFPSVYKMALSLGGSRPQHNAWFLGPNRDHSPNGTSINTYGRRAFSVAGPMAWNSLPSGIQRAAQTVLGVYLKRTCSRVTSASSALGVLNDYALYKSTHSLTHSLDRFTRFITAHGCGQNRRHTPCYVLLLLHPFNGLYFQDNLGNLVPER